MRFLPIVSLACLLTACVPASARTDKPAAPDPSNEKAVRAYIAAQLATVVGYRGDLRGMRYMGAFEKAEISGPVVKRNLYGTELPTWCVSYRAKLSAHSSTQLDRNAHYTFNFRKDDQGRWSTINYFGNALDTCETPYRPFPELERARAALLPRMPANPLTGSR